MGGARAGAEVELAWSDLLAGLAAGDDAACLSALSRWPASFDDIFCATGRLSGVAPRMPWSVAWSLRDGLIASADAYPGRALRELSAQRRPA